MLGRRRWIDCCSGVVLPTGQLYSRLRVQRVVPLLREVAESSHVALNRETAVGAVAQLRALRRVLRCLPGEVGGVCDLGEGGEGDGETLTQFRAAFVSDENRDQGPEVLHVEGVGGGVSPLVMVAVVIGGRRRGAGVRDDGAVGAVRVRWRAGNVVQ